MKKLLSKIVICIIHQIEVLFLSKRRVHTVTTTTLLNNWPN